MLVVTIWWKRNRVWVLLWLCDDRFLLFPPVVDVSALSICIVLRAVVVVISMCLLYVSLGSRVSPSIFGLLREVGWVCMMCLCSCLCLVLELE